MAGTRSRQKHLLLGSLVLVSSLIACTLIGEALTRIFLKRHVDTELLRANLDQTNIKVLIQPNEDPDLMYELRPGMDIMFQGSRVVTDISGVRVGSKLSDSPDNAIRIALIGDSTAFGWRVNYEDTFGERLRQALQRSTAVQVDLRNFSVPGYNASQEYRTFVVKVMPYRPHLLIVHHDHNDSQRTGAGYPPNYFSPEYGDNALHSSLLKFALRQTRTLRNRWGKRSESDSHEYVDGYYVSGPLYEAHLESRSALARDAKSFGIPTVVVIFNAGVEADDDYENSDRYLRLHKQLAQRLEGMGLYVLDLYPHYQNMLKELGWRDLSRLWIDSDDRHPNPEGHEFISGVLLQFLRDQPELYSVFTNQVGEAGEATHRQK